LRVLRIIARLNVGGPARHVTILDMGLGRRGFDTRLAHGDVGEGEATLETLIQDAGIRATRIPGLGRRISPLSDLRAFFCLVRLVFRYQPDIVHTHTAKAGTLGRLAAALYNLTRSRPKRCLVVHTFHGHVLEGYFGRAGSMLVRGAERALAPLTDRICVLSPRQRRDLGERFRVAPLAKLAIVPLGLELDHLMRLPGPRPASAVTFGFVGRLVPIKNLPLLLDAFAVVHRADPRTRLLVTGDGELRRYLEARAVALGVPAAVTFSGWQNDLPAVYGSMDVLVLSSLNEGTPVAAIEAMAAALPVIATDVGGVADVVTHDETGLLVPSLQAAPLASAMLRLAGSLEDRRRLGFAGREAVARRFTAERLVNDIERLYRTGLSEKRRRRLLVAGGERR
jgi:glycosyltransferase involved in cell wall biosynthesis